MYKTLKWFITIVLLIVIVVLNFTTVISAARFTRCEPSLLIYEGVLPHVVVDNNESYEELDYDDLLSPSNVSADELEAVVKYDLKPLVDTFLEAENEYGVNAVYLIAISALESGWGRYQFYDNNIFGFGSKEFDSEEECIMYVAEFIRTHYLQKDGMYYGGGFKLKHVNKSWNGSSHWLEVTTEIADSLIEKLNTNRESSSA